MSPSELRERLIEAANTVADYFEEIEDYPVLPWIEEGELKRNLPPLPPEEGEEFEKIFKDFREKILPAATHWNHPGFHAYFNSTSSAPGIIAELFSAALNQNGMLWKTSPASAELEEVVLDWFRREIKLPETFRGIIYDTASVSSMHAIVAARERLKGLNIREKGMAGRQELCPLTIYISEQAHSSIEKGAITTGIGLENVRKIPVNENFEMRTDLLKEAIAEDKKNGKTPFCVVATVGTTSTTSIDPVNEIAGICQEENLWLHVDAAYAGVTAMLPEFRKYFEGMEKADSIVINPHKWLFTPIDLSVFFVRDFKHLKDAFSLVPEYLKTDKDEKVTNYMDYGIQLGRRFRSLKLWFIFRYFGVEGLRARLREHIRLARLFEEWVERSDRFEKLAPVPFSTVCFRAKHHKLDEETTDKFNLELMNAVNSDGRIFISHTVLNGVFSLRFVVSGIRHNEDGVKKAWKIINDFYEKKLGEFL